MTDNQNGNGAKLGRPKKEPITEKTIEQNDLDTIFSSVPTGYSVCIHREDPLWAAGYLGKLMIDGQTPINLDLIKARYGGRVILLKIQDERGKYKGQKRITFPEPPRRDGKEMFEHGPPKEQQQPGINQQIPQGLPPHLAQQLAAFYAGVPIAPPIQQQQQPQQNPFDAMQAKTVMDMINSQMTAQSDQLKAHQSHLREMERIRRDAEEERDRRERGRERNREPLGEMQQTLAVIRELNGFKSELGQSDTTGELIAHGAPIVENAIGDLISLQKMKMQAEISSLQNPQRNPAPALPARQPQTNIQVPQTAPEPPPQRPKGGNGKTSPVELARQMRAMYEGLTVEEQTKVMGAFMGDEIEENEENEEKSIKSFDETIGKGLSLSEDSETEHELLDDEDRAILAGANGSDQGTEISNSQHATPIEGNDPPDRPGN